MPRYCSSPEILMIPGNIEPLPECQPEGSRLRSVQSLNSFWAGCQIAKCELLSSCGECRPNNTYIFVTLGCLLGGLGAQFLIFPALTFSVFLKTPRGRRYSDFCVQSGNRVLVFLDPFLGFSVIMKFIAPIARTYLC